VRIVSWTLMVVLITRVQQDRTVRTELLQPTWMTLHSPPLSVQIVHWAFQYKTTNVKVCTQIMDVYTAVLEICLSFLPIKR